MVARRTSGGRIGTLNLPSTLDGSGVFSLAQQQQLAGSNRWPIVYASPQAVANLGITTDGFYAYKSGSMTQAVALYTKFNFVDSKPWVRVFSSPFASTATVNEVDKNIPWKGFMIQRDSNDYRGTGYYSSAQTFNTRGDTSTAASGTYAGYRIYIGQAGGHGFYNTVQSPCSWSNSGGALGAGYDGSCGTFPNAMRWGTGNSGSPHYTMVGGTWETWIWWD